jgi:hypothetical protein
VDQGQDRDERSELDGRRALRGGGQHQVRGGDAERGAVVLGHLVSVVAEPLVGLDQRQTLGELRGRRSSGCVVVIEDGEAHRLRPPGQS